MSNFAASRDADFLEEVDFLKTHNLIISGAHDLAIIPADGHCLFKLGFPLAKLWCLKNIVQ